MFKINFSPLKEKRIINPEDLLPKTVEDTRGNLMTFDPQKIIESLIIETQIPKKKAIEVTINVLRRISSLGLEFIAAPHIRELVCGELTSQGLHQYRNLYTRLGIPIYDVKMMLQGNKDVTQKDSTRNLTLSYNWIASQVIEQYVHLDQLSGEARNLHLTGRINIDLLQYWDEPISQQWDLRTILLYGIPPINLKGVAKTRPASSALTAVSHAAKWLGLVSGEFSGGHGYDNFTAFIAPYLSKLEYNLGDPNRIDILQVAQSFVYETNQVFGSISSPSRDIFIGCTPFIPDELKNIDAVGPGGNIKGKYGDFEKECQQFFKALVEVYGAGDADGKPIYIPRHEIKISNQGLVDFEADYKYAVEKETIPMGTTCFVNSTLNSNENAINNDAIRINLITDTQNPQQTQPFDPCLVDFNKNLINFGIIQNININLPRAALLSKKESTDIQSQLDLILPEIEKILLKKRTLIEKAVNSDITQLPFCAGCLEESHLEATHILDIKQQFLSISCTGLEECVKILTGEGLKNKSALSEAIKIIQYLQNYVQKATERNNCHIILTEHSSEDSESRFAKLDLRYFPTEASKIVKGDDTKYYTKGFNLDLSNSEIDLWESILTQGKLHKEVYNGTLLQIPQKLLPTTPNDLWKYIKKIFTESSVIRFKIEQ
jgi:ribonucleoside-triphosphate reductase (formate)